MKTNYLSKDRSSGPFSWILKAVGLFFLLVILILFFGRFFSGLFQTIGKPIWQVKNAIGRSAPFSFLASKQKLLIENQDLKDRINKLQLVQTQNEILSAENDDLKKIMANKKSTDQFILTSILERPPQSPYDLFVVDVGKNEGVAVGQTVFAAGNLALGKIAGTSNNTSTIQLFSSPGERSQVLIKSASSSIAATATGKGAGNYSISLPVGVEISVGDPVILTGSSRSGIILGSVGSIDTPPNATFQNVLVISPINLRTIRFLEILK